jgi:hypothetical protein
LKCDLCGKDATVWRGCYNQDCSNTTYLHLCDEHADTLTRCHLCGGDLDKGPLPPAKDSTSAATDEEMFEEDSDAVEQPELLSVDELCVSCNKGAVKNTDQMGVTVKVCNGIEQVEAVLGHSFAEMRQAEKEIRKQCGVSVKHGSASGMNIALMELRLLLVDSDCNIFQIAVRFADKLQRNILLCSTAGTVLTDQSEITRLEALGQMASPEEQLVVAELKARKLGGDKLVRCCASSTAYAGRQLFALCGAYSFFQPGDGVALAAERYEVEHEGVYRKLVGAPDHPQLFHHSEQAGFKALLQQIQILARIITTLRARAILPNTKLSLEAVSIDVFTTRSVCNGCMRAAQTVLVSDGHFFALALKAVVAKCPNVVIDRVRKLIRFDCEVMFKDGLVSCDLPKSCLILHGTPRTVQGAVPTPTGALHIIDFRLTCNHNDNPLLDNGTLKSVVLPVLAAAKEMLKITEVTTIEAVRDFFFRQLVRFQSDIYSGAVLATYLLNQFCAGTGVNPMMGELKRTAGAMGISAQSFDNETLRLAAKFYYFFDFLKLKQNDGENSGLILSCAYFLKAADLGSCMTAFRIAYGQRFHADIAGSEDTILGFAKKYLTAIMKKLLDNDDAPSENTARVLAIFFGAVAEYQKLLEE